MNKLIIDRSKWRTGADNQQATGLGPTLLRNNQGFKCCLGFFCEQALGNISVDLFGVLPHYVVLSNPNTFDKLSLLVEKRHNGYFNTNDFGSKAAEINDATNMTRKGRENQVTRHFAEKGIEVVFEGEYVDYVD